MVSCRTCVDKFSMVDLIIHVILWTAKHEGLFANFDINAVFYFNLAEPRHAKSEDPQCYFGLCCFANWHWQASFNI